MQLAYTTTSPYTRRVAVMVTEIGFDDRVERITVDNSSVDSDYVRINPLMKVPSLILDDGRALIDSTAICDYLDSLHDGAKLFAVAGPERVEQMQLQALVNGMQEAATQVTGERIRRPQTLRWPDFIEKQLFKATHGFDRLEEQVDYLHGPVNYAVLCTSVMCAHFDFRLPDFDWRTGRSKLAGWFDDFARRPSMQMSAFRSKT